MGQEEVVKYLLSSTEVTVNSYDRAGCTPLWHAADSGRTEIVRIFYQTGKADFDIGCRSPSPETSAPRFTAPLHQAAFKGCDDVVRYLIGTSEQHARNAEGQTALLVAVKNRDLDIVKYLITKVGADVEARNTMGQTALLVAAMNRDLDIVKLILDVGADVEARDGAEGQTALLVAATIGHLDIVKYLIAEAGADVEARDRQGMTALLWAGEQSTQWSGHLEIVRYLITEAGADAGARDNLGRNILRRVLDFPGARELKELWVRMDPWRNRSILRPYHLMHTIALTGKCDPRVPDLEGNSAMDVVERWMAEINESDMRTLKLNEVMRLFRDFIERHPA
ncbi:ankyrin repeat-containing domain protein [Triangularia verruculosa]|uniref:Ankyrin repeat-containing domain protein n=1 Tax=Triangularia verruculosa TaxID=2587418 RepID=A0AAN6XV31_9PEZI|nr:ankyrin repeat-containing domain protein [Triangularia verruculosa]